MTPERNKILMEKPTRRSQKRKRAACAEANREVGKMGATARDKKNSKRDRERETRASSARREKVWKDQASEWCSKLSKKRKTTIGLLGEKKK